MGNKTIYEYLAMMKKENLAVETSNDVAVLIPPHKQWNFPLPEGATGICFVFKNKKAARKYYGRGVKLIPVKVGEG